jgi:hypothetical protein
VAIKLPCNALTAEVVFAGSQLGRGRSDFLVCGPPSPLPILTLSARWI